jgi:uncharacterized protein YwgA
MDRLKKVIACMKEVGKKRKVDSFEDKLVIQQMVYLLKLMGFSTAYPFSLYVRGTYSPELTRDLYEHKDEVEGLRTDYELPPKESRMLAQLLEASNNLDPTLLEIMGTYEYFIKTGKNSREALTELKNLKPFFSESKIAVGVSRAKQLFPPDETEIRKMKAEFAELEAATFS